MANKKNPTNPQILLQNAQKFIQNNEFELASKILKEGQANFPKEFLFINLLAQISLRNKKIIDGITLLKQSLQINPQQQLVMFDLGIALSLNDQLDEAVIFFDKSIELEPRNLKVYVRKAITLRKLNRVNDSIDCYQKIIDLDPNFIDAYTNKAELLYSIGELEESLHFYQQAIKIDIENPTLFIRCGIIFSKLDRIGEAISSYKKSIAITSENPGAFKNLAYIFKDLRQYDKACFYLKKTAEINPDYEVLTNLAQIYCQLGNYKEGIVHYDKAIKVQPGNAEVHALKAYACNSQGEFNQAILSFDNALNVDKDFKYSYGDRFHAKKNICDWSNFEQDLNWLNLKIKERKSVAVPLAICGFVDDPGTHKLGAELFVHDKFPLDNSLGPISKYPKNKKIKIGYFSGDFTEHPVAYLVTELFKMHDKSKFELYAFSYSTNAESKIRLRIQKSFDEFIDVSNHGDKQITLMSREKNIDIAIDLSGHTKNSRPSIFAMRAAPIQINFLGYPGTTGASYIDYNISDKFIIPKELLKYYSEKIIYLPKCYQPNEEKIIPGTKVFSRRSEGLPDSGFVFCCFNNSWKITPQIFKVWIRLLLSVDGSVLWFPGFSSFAIKNLKKECAKLGVDENRLIFSSIEKLRQDHHKKIKLADIFLDCFPYGAQSTATDFLRVGIPIVTLRGLSFSNRVASSLLMNLNLPELITTTEVDYENLAIKLANNPKYLNEIKAKLILNVETSSIFNVEEYTRSVESAYTMAYERYHDNLNPENLEPL